MGVWRVYGWCLIDPGHCQDCIDGITIDKNILYHYIQLLPFLRIALHNANINRFDCVWKVSGPCLGNSEYCLEDYHATPIDETPMKEQ